MKKISVLLTLLFLVSTIAPVFAAEGDTVTPTPTTTTQKVSVKVTFPDSFEIENWPDYEPYLVSGLFSINNSYANNSDYKMDNFDFTISKSHITIANIVEKYIYEEQKSPVSNLFTDDDTTKQQFSYLIDNDYWHRDSGIKYSRGTVGVDLDMKLDLVPDSKSDTVMSLIKIYEGVIPSRPIMFQTRPVRNYAGDRVMEEVKGNQYTYAGLTSIPPSAVIIYNILNDYDVYINPNVTELYLEKAYSLGLIDEEELDPSTDFYDYRDLDGDLLPKWNNSLNAVYPFGLSFPDLPEDEDGDAPTTTSSNTLSSMSTADEIGGTEVFGQGFASNFGQLNTSLQNGFISSSASLIAKGKSYFETEDMTMLDLFELIEKYMRVYEKDLTELETEIINYRLSSAIPEVEGKDTMMYLLAMGIIDFEEPLHNPDKLVSESDIVNYLYRVANKASRSTFEFIELSEVEKELSDMGYVSNEIEFEEKVTLDYSKVSSETVSEDEIYPVKYKILMNKDENIGKWGYSYRSDWFLTNTENTINRIGEYGIDYTVGYEEPYMVYKCTQELYDLLSYQETVYLNTTNGLDYPGVVRIDDGPGIYVHSSEVLDSTVGRYATTALITKKIDTIAFLDAKASGIDENDTRLYTVELGLKINGSVEDADPKLNIVPEITDLLKQHAVDYNVIATDSEYLGYSDETSTMNFKILTRATSEDRARLQAWGVSDTVFAIVLGNGSTLEEDTSYKAVALLNEDRQVYESYVPQNMLSEFGFTVIQEMILYHESSETFIFIIDNENAICGNTVYNVRGNTFQKLESDGRLFYSAELLTSSDKTIGDYVKLDTRTFGRSRKINDYSSTFEEYADYDIHVSSNSKKTNYIDYVKNEARCLIEFTYEVPGEGSAINPSLSSELDLLNYMNTRPTWSSELEAIWDGNYNLSNGILKEIFGEDVDYEISGWLVPKVYKYQDVFTDNYLDVPANIASIAPIESTPLKAKLNGNGLYMEEPRIFSTDILVDGMYNILTWDNPLKLELKVSDEMLLQYNINDNNYSAKIRENGLLLLYNDQGQVIKTLSSSDYHIEEKEDEVYELVDGSYNIFNDLKLETGLMYNLGRRIVSYDYLEPVSEAVAGDIFFMDGYRFIKNDKGGITIDKATLGNHIDTTTGITADMIQKSLDGAAVVVNGESIPIYSFEEDSTGLYWYLDLSSNKKTIWKNATAYNVGYFEDIPLVEDIEFDVKRELLKTLTTIETTDSTIDEIDSRINEVQELVKRNKYEMLKYWIKFVITAIAYVLVFIILAVYMILRFGIFKTTLEQLVAAHDLDLLYILSFGRLDIGSQTNIFKTVGVIFLIMLMMNVFLRMI